MNWQQKPLKHRLVSFWLINRWAKGAHVTGHMHGNSPCFGRQLCGLQSSARPRNRCYISMSLSGLMLPCSLHDLPPNKSRRCSKRVHSRGGMRRKKSQVLGSSFFISPALLCTVVAMSEPLDSRFIWDACRQLLCCCCCCWLCWPCCTLWALPRLCCRPCAAASGRSSIVKFC